MNTAMKTKQHGLTMIELMIAVLLSVFVTAAVIKMFTGSNKSRHLQENIARLQENGRFAMDFIIADTRMAGHWGPCNNLTTNNLNTSGVGVDNFGGTNIITAVDNDSNSANDIIDGTDAIVLRAINYQIDGIKLTSAMTARSSSLSIPSVNTLNHNDLALVAAPSCNSSDIFQITNNPSGGAINHAAGGASPGNTSADLSVAYPVDSEVYQLNFTTYSIRTGVNGRPSLFRRVNNGSHEELVEGIENMQILYGEDSDSDGSVDYYVSAGDITDMNKVKSIRTTLKVATLDDNLSISFAAPPFNDRRIRRTFTSTTTIRNQISN